MWNIVRARTSSRNVATRYLLTIISFLLKNIWVSLQWIFFSRVRRDQERLMKICSVLISSGSSFGKVFVKNPNSLLLLRFFEVSVEWSVILVADYPIFTEEILEKYWG
jgi:hypothetical protein